jgi:hypothetical protein
VRSPSQTLLKSTRRARARCRLSSPLSIPQPALQPFTVDALVSRADFVHGRQARGGSLGSFKKGAMVPEFDAVCFDEDVPLGGTAVNGPVKTQFGHHLIQVYERAAAK